MKLLRSSDIPLDEIEVTDRLRAVDLAYIEALQASMADIGLQQAIQVAVVDADYRLLAGAHRLEAARGLGWETIRADVWTADHPALAEDEYRLFEVDENLFRRDLEPLDRAAFIAERQRLFLSLFPDAGHGGNRKKRGQVATIATWSFTKETLKRTGLKPRTVRRSLQMFRGLAPDVRRSLAGTDLAGKEGELFRLSLLDHAGQRKVIEMMAKAGGPRTVEAAKAILDGKTAAPTDPKEAGLRKLLEAWARANNPARKSFLVHLQDAGIVEGFDLDGAADDDEEGGEAE
jgi:ParB family chromosome partitioning protein